MDLQLPRLTIRAWRADDAQHIASLADNYAIWRNLRDRFPHPYSLADAHAFIERTHASTPHRNYAITLHDVPIGSIGLIPGEDIYRKAAEFGYWLGEPHWGRGYATEAITGFTSRAFELFDLVRLHAFVFTWNVGSARALEKAGFVREATSRCAAVKEGTLCDEWLYAKIRPGITTGDAV
jgi:RimJ/RimL family protein N-acetyltransferase